MNKSEFIKELSKQTSYNEERCNTINNIVITEKGYTLLLIT